MALEHQYNNELDQEALWDLSNVLEEYLEISADRVQPGEGTNGTLRHNAIVKRTDAAEIVGRILANIDPSHEDVYVELSRQVRDQLKGFYKRNAERICIARGANIEDPRTMENMREAFEVFVFEAFLNAQREHIVYLKRMNEATNEGWAGGAEMSDGDPIEEVVSGTQSGVYSVLDQGPPQRSQGEGYDHSDWI